MKKIYQLAIRTVCVCLLFAGCENAEYAVVDNSVYISEAAGSSKSTILTMEDAVTVNINIRLAKKIDEAVEVGVRLNPALIEAYNAANNSEYFSVPNFQLPVDAKVVIPANEIGATYSFQIESFETEGKQYALGVELDVLSGGINKSVSQSNFVYLISKPLKGAVPVMNGRRGKVNVAPAESWGITTNQWSLECWTRMSGFNRNNQAIFNAGSPGQEVYIRFGDANGPYNYLQIKTLGGQVQTASDLKANQWYHWAFVYDGTSLTIYRNGEQDVKFNPPAPVGGTVRFDKMEMIASGSYFVDECALAQVRLWKIALSQSQIKNGMYFSVNPANPGLIGYWPMDEGEGNTFRDITGNGHEATAEAEVIKRWIPSIRFDQLQ